jgi:hypothetical protein
MLYNPEIPTSSTPATAIPVLTGKSLAHMRLTPAQAAAFAAQIHLGEVQLVPTLKAACTQTGANCAYAQRMTQKTPVERQWIARDGLWRPAWDRPEPAAKPSLFDAWNAADPAERVIFGRAIGVDRVWNDTIVPNI